MTTLPKRLIFDGAMGTMLQKSGMKPGTIPETLNVNSPEIIENIHRAYLEAGSNTVLSNTFGANRFKAEAAQMPLDLLVQSAIKIARKAADSFEHKYVALDIGPCGKVLEPCGDFPFDEAVEVFAEIIRAGSSAGADFIVLETFTDLNELKAAIIAAKENSALPVFATMSFEANGSTFFGTTVESMIMTLEGLGVSALGVNCSLGPKQLMPIVEKLVKHSRIPVLVQPNAGLPVMENGVTRYDITADEFAQYAKKFVEMGVSFIGGCCGTSPEYIKKVCTAINGIETGKREIEPLSGICSSQKQSYFDRMSIIGERLNPTGKKKLQSALRSKDFEYLRREAVNQQNFGADSLDLNVGLPDINEPEMLKQAVLEIQSATHLPLVLDSSSPEALERAARIYCGKPLINSVNGTEESMSKVLPIVRKYGCAVLGLALDEHGVPDKAEDRLEIARKIVKRAESEGINRDDIFIDCLTLTVSAQPHQALETLRAVELVKKELGVKTILGVSNVSFGLPQRPIINRTMLAMAFAKGLDAAIMNPADSGMMETVFASRLLFVQDDQAKEYIDKFSQIQVQQQTVKAEQSTAQPKPQNEALLPKISEAISLGLKGEAANAAKELLKTKKPLEIVETEIIPALDAVGKDYETGAVFLPQLIYSAEAAQSAFEVLRGAMAHTESKKGEKFVLATVHGDIHDIGKNIVKVILENYNYDVIDLGKDVPPEDVVHAVKESGAKLVGLSALMTTTVSSMKDTVTLLHRECPCVKIVVGGAVLSESMAEFVGADKYAKDAMATVHAADDVLSQMMKIC